MKDMTVSEFAEHLKEQRKKLFDASSDRHDSNKWRSRVIGQRAAEKGGVPPVIARHTRASMQRRRTK